MAAIVLDVVASASLWHILSLGALSGAVGMLRLRRRERGYRITAALASAVLVGQPALHLAGELSHRSTDLQSTHGAVHVGLLLLHFVLATAAALVIAVSDVLVLAMAEVLLRVIRLLAVLQSPVPEHLVPRVFTSNPRIAGRFPAWVAYAVRRGPPRPA